MAHGISISHDQKKRVSFYAPGDYLLMRDVAVTWSVKSSSSSSRKFTATVNLDKPVNLIGDKTFGYHAFEVDFDLTSASFTEDPPEWWGNAEPGYPSDYCPGVYEAEVSPTAAYSTISDHIGNYASHIMGIDIRRQELVDEIPTNAVIGEQQFIPIVPKAGGTVGVKIITSYFGLLVPEIGGQRKGGQVASIDFEMNIHESSVLNMISGLTINSSTLKSLWVRHVTAGES